MSTRTMPAQKPGKSKQDYGTPWELIHAVEKRWGPLALDLAAHDSGDNAKAPAWIGESDDYLKQVYDPSDWPIKSGALCWCNPPFENIAPWAAKWLRDSIKWMRIIALVPASIGAEWFADHCESSAKIVALRPRLAFEGGGHQAGCADETCMGCQTYPKDCMLLLWGPGFEQDARFFTWRWK